jgi:ABC-type Fe3+/spermidine/putrescine transport system ATPase subunit
MAAPRVTPPDRVPADVALELIDLRREFGDKVAVDDVSLRVPHGSFY